MTDSRLFYVTLTYIPNGRSEPEERTVYGDPGEELADLAERAAEECWRRNDEPILVTSPLGRVMWGNEGRWGDLS